MTAITSSDIDQSKISRHQRDRERRFQSMRKIRNSTNYVGPGFIIALSLGTMALIAFFAAFLEMSTVDAFTTLHLPTAHRSSTKIFLEDWVADMIDGELYRQEHHKEYEEAWMKKNKGAVLSRLSDASDTLGLYPSQMVSDGDREAFAEHNRDKRMAFLKPEKYCADRCVATGNCDILEDFYELGPEDVLKFCEECVLNFDDETVSDENSSSGCEIPDAFYEKEPPLRP